MSRAEERYVIQQTNMTDCLKEALSAYEGVDLGINDLLSDLCEYVLPEIGVKNATIFRDE